MRPARAVAVSRQPARRSRRSAPPAARASGRGGGDRVNVDALRQITDDSGGRTEIIYSNRDLDPATAGIADELSRQYFLVTSRHCRRTADGTRSTCRSAGASTSSARGKGSSPVDAAFRRTSWPCAAVVVRRRPSLSLMWLAVLALSAAGSVGGLLVASIMLVFHKDVRARVVPSLVSYAVGTLLGAALLGLVPEALAALPPHPRAHDAADGHLHLLHSRKTRPLASLPRRHGMRGALRARVPLVIVGHTVHTLVDGIVIAAAALVSLPLGVTAALAVAAHEVPQVAGDFAVVLAAGRSRRSALALNSVGGARRRARRHSMLLFGGRVPQAVPYVPRRLRPGIFSTSRWPISFQTSTTAKSIAVLYDKIVLIALGVLTMVAL